MNEKPPVQKSHNLRNFIIIPVLVLVGLIAIAGGLSVIDHISQQSRINQYLNEKYGQEFVVENVHISGAGLGVEGAWRADAYQKSDPSLKFQIRELQTTAKVYTDTFLQNLWSRQGSVEVRAFLSKEFPDNEGYTLTITPGRKLYESIQGSVPDLETILKDHKNQISYSLSVRNVVDLSSSEPSDAQLENALKVVNFVKAKGTSPAMNAYYNYRENSFEKRDSIGQQEYQYGIQLERDELSSINTAIDLKNYFKILWQ